MTGLAIRYCVGICVAAAAIAAAAVYLGPVRTASYSSSTATSTPTTTPAFVVTHVPTPPAVRGIYMSSFAASSQHFRDTLIPLIDRTELNAVVIDVKDFTGRVSWLDQDPAVADTGSPENRIPDLEKFLAYLHSKDIYVIGRLQTFEDPYYAAKHPEDAVQSKKGGIWKNTGGLSWIDAGAKPFWDYTVALAKDAYAAGFDEIQFDYVRFPSDGDLKDMKFTWETATSTRAEVIGDFFSYLDQNLRQRGIPISADLFGLTTIAKDDMGIGQLMEVALPHFDYISPMVYPSHYAAGFDGFAEPAKHPYEVIYHSMASSTERALMASSTSSKIRPWLQDFTLYGVGYSPEMIRAEKQAVYDNGLSGWMMWNAANRYTEAALDPAASSTGSYAQ